MWHLREQGSKSAINFVLPAMLMLSGKSATPCPYIAGYRYPFVIPQVDVQANTRAHDFCFGLLSLRESKTAKPRPLRPSKCCYLYLQVTNAYPCVLAAGC